MKKHPLAFISFLFLSLFLSACGEKPPATAKSPTITLSETRLPEGGHVWMKGSGFTPLSDAVSHLKKPDGSEYNTIIFLTNEKGEFDHDIESFLLPIGVMEVWVVDVKTGVSSNVAKFETTHDQMPLAK